MVVVVSNKQNASDRLKTVSSLKQKQGSYFSLQGSFSVSRTLQKMSSLLSLPLSHLVNKTFAFVFSFLTHNTNKSTVTISIQKDDHDVREKYKGR